MKKAIQKGPPITLKELSAIAGKRAHLAILVQPYLGKLLKGEKTIESRWMKHRIAPYGRVNTGDIVYVKKSGGLVVASFVVGWVKEGQVKPLTAFGAAAFAYANQGAICINDTFIRTQLDSKNFAVFVEVTDLKPLTPFPLEKAGMAGWVVLP